MKVSNDASVETFKLFDRDAQQILSTTTFELLHTKNANKADIPQYCIPFANALLFLKSSSQLTTWLKDFKPILSQGHLFQKISLKIL